MIRFQQVELTIHIRRSKGGEIHQKAIWVMVLLGSVIPSRNYHIEELRVVTRSQVGA
jgi:hypothetical protein